ncbi:MAG TPA: hypothetical protein VII06_20635 [Chloroflexota bacterium]|jgi:hypothetical protein
MDDRGRWVVLGLVALALIYGGRRLWRIADPDARDYARPPSRR